MKFPVNSHTLKIIGIALLAGVIICVCLNLRVFNLFLLDDFVEAKVVNHMSNFAGRGSFDSHLRIVLIPEKENKGKAPWGDSDRKHREFFAQLIRAMTTAKAKVLAFDAVLDGKSEFDQELGNAITAARKAGLKVIVGTERDLNGKVASEIPAELNQPEWGLVEVGAYQGNENDGKPIRAMKLGEVDSANASGVVPSLALRVVMDSQSLVPDLQPEWNRLLLYSDQAKQQLWRTVPLERGQYMILDQASANDLYTARVDAQRIFDDFNDSQALSEKYKDAIVLVGYEMGEAKPIPAGGTRLGVELHATTVSNILQQVFIYKLPLIYSYIIVFIMALLAAVMYTPVGKWLDYKVEFTVPWIQKQVRLPLGVVIIGALYLGVFFVLFMFRRIYLDLTYHLAALVLSYGMLWLWWKNFAPDEGWHLDY